MSDTIMTTGTSVAVPPYAWMALTLHRPGLGNARFAAATEPATAVDARNLKATDTVATQDIQGIPPRGHAPV